MRFHRDRVIDHVTNFYTSRGAAAGTRYVVVSNLDDALRLAVVHGPDLRLTQAPLRHAATAIQDLDGDRHVSRGAHDLVFEHAVRREATQWRFRTGQVFVHSADRAAITRHDGLRAAYRDGMGWLIAADHTAIIVPSPVVRRAEGQPGVLHDDTGRMAVVWPDGHGYYFLHGLEFDKRLYLQVIDHQLLIQDIAALDNADMRAVALQYLTFEQLVIDSNAEMLNRGVRGTALYRLELPPRLARDRKAGHGGYDYFIYMRDASHPEREFIEWVDPEIGRLRDAELCQAAAFGISLDEWLSVEQEG